MLKDAVSHNRTCADISHDRPKPAALTATGMQTRPSRLLGSRQQTSQLWGHATCTNASLDSLNPTELSTLDEIQQSLGSGRTKPRSAEQLQGVRYSSATQPAGPALGMAPCQFSSVLNGIYCRAAALDTKTG